MRKILLLVSFCPLLLTSACALHISGLQDARGTQTLYAFSEEHDAFAAAYEGIVSVIPDAPVKAVSGAMRGYSVTEKNLLSSEDEAAFTISILPGTGKTSAGENIFGYYAEVSVKNDSLSGRLTAKKIYRAIIANFARDGRAAQVEHIRLGKYTGGAFLRGGGDRVNENGDLVENFSLAKELGALNQLRREGALSATEYEAVKARVLREF